MTSVEIRRVETNKKQYLALLLLADEQEDMIDRYLERGSMYVLEDDGVKAECVVTDEGGGVLELKNIAVEPDFQGKGYGKALVDFLIRTYAGQYMLLQVGTGDSIREIKVALEGQRIPTVSGKVEWMGSHIRSILTNEKYCGDVLLQKTFIQDCISKKVIPNTGQLPKYLIQNHHEGIVSREIFDAVQLEMARRNAKAGATRKSTPTGRGKYSGKHVLSNLLFCGECGTAYRRCVWTQHGVKRPVWRCVSRLDYGKKFCTQSPTLDEEPLQQAILAAVNAVMLDRDTLARQLAAVMEWELAPVLGESMSLADIDRALEELSSQFNSLLAEASANPAEDYTGRFRELSESTARLKERKAQLEGACQEQGRLQNRLRAVSAAMEHMTAAMTEWDEEVIHQLLEKVTVLSREKIRVTFRDGREIEQYVAQPKRRKLA